nr:hypothetical protein [Tanacetum cinerariifolium]
LEKFQDDRMKAINDKFDKLYTDFVEIALQLEEKFYQHLLTTIFDRRWLLTQGVELAITKCLNSPEYLSAHGAAIGKSIEKEVDYISALQQLQNVNFPLLAELKSHKDTSIKAVMNVLRLEEPLADKLRLNELQRHVNQLMVPIHHSPNKVIVGATALSLALDVSSIRVQKIKENIDTQRSVLHDVFAPLSEPFSAAVLTVVGTNDQADADGNAESFPNVDDEELNIPR